MTTTTHAPSTPTPPDARRPAPLAGSRVLLWLPVLAAAAMAWLLTRAFYAVSDGAPDLDPLYGLMLLLYWSGAVVLGAVSLGLALAYSFKPPASRAPGALGSAVLTAVGGLAIVALSVVSNATDPMLTVSSTAGDQLAWEGAAAFVVLAPLGAVLVARLAGRERARRA